MQLKWAVYDLSVNPPAYDFLVFMQIALQEGANAVWFIPGVQKGIQTQGGEEEEKRRLREVALPICDLYGLPREFGEWQGLPAVWPQPNRAKVEVDGKLIKIRAHQVYWLKHVTKPYPVMPTQQALDRANDRFKGKKPIVVTLRQSRDRPLRDSGPDWRKWAEDHEAVVLEDSCVSGMSIDDRVAHYELASLNIGSNSGMLHLCYLSHRPYLALRMVNNFYPHDASEAWWKKNGWSVGEQMPWATKNQKLVWNYVDDYETIEREYQQYQARR
jgi:hypothetical protein